MIIDGESNRQANALPTIPWEPNYRSRSFSGSVLLTADHGAWAILSLSDFAQLRVGLPPISIFNDLVDKGLLRTAENETCIEQMLRTWHAPNAVGPDLHIVVLTRRCNLQCTYCHADARPERSSGEDLSSDTAKAILDFIVTTPSHSVNIEFQGGESLLNWEVLCLAVEYGQQLSQATGKRIDFSLVTNATLLSREKIKFLRQNRVQVCTSLDGPAWIHDMHRRSHGRGTFDLVTRKIELAEALGLRIPFLTVLTRQSYGHYRSIVDFSLERGAQILCMNPVEPLGIARSRWGQIGCDCITRLGYYRSLLDYMFEKIKNGQFILERRFALALDKITRTSDVKFADFRNPCGAIFGQIAYDIDGVIYPCDEARGFKELALGTIRTHSFDEIAHSPLATTIHQASIPRSKECVICAYKPFCGLCPVLAFAASGNFEIDPSDDSRCRSTIFLFDYLFEKLIREPEDISLILKTKRIQHAISEATKMDSLHD
ncbi:MAG: radical SAM protein [Desulfobaccales bacterium]